MALLGLVQQVGIGIKEIVDVLLTENGAPQLGIALLHLSHKL